MQAEIGRISDVQFLGRGYYHVEFANAESIMKLLQLKIIGVKGSRIRFMPWEHGLDAVADVAEEDIFQYTAVFSGPWEGVCPYATKVGIDD